LLIVILLLARIAAIERLADALLEARPSGFLGVPELLTRVAVLAARPPFPVARRATLRRLASGRAAAIAGLRGAPA
jgi:hypothetical protein